MTAPIRWVEISVAAHPEAVEAVSEILDRVGYNGIAVEQPLGEGPHLVKAYVVYDHAARVKVRRVKEAVGRLRAFGLGPIGEVSLRRIADEDWLESWKSQFQPLRLGPFFVRPSWSTARSAEGIEIVLDPGMAFGTGLHPTTRQCLEAVGELDVAGRAVLDVGTGSGILAIAAAKRGAHRVVAVDTDPLAVRAAADNARRNDVAVDVSSGSAADVAGTFEVVLANLVADVLVRLAADLRARLAPGGALVCAGIVQEKEAAVSAAFQAAGLAVRRRVATEDWVRLDLA